MVQLSCKAARHKNTDKIAKAYRIMACEPPSFSSREVPLHSKPKPAGNWLASASISVNAAPVLKPGAALPLMRMAG